MLRSTSLAHQLTFFVFLFTLSLLPGCGLVEEPETTVVTCSTGCSTTTSSSSAQSGVFLDSAVNGVTYSTSSGLSGTTNELGEFAYNPGDRVSFRLGDVQLGSVSAADVLTPVEVVGASETAEDAVINLARFLQTLDEDNDASNGITITSAAWDNLQADIDFHQTTDNFASTVGPLVSSMGKTLVSANDALNHLHGSLQDHGKGNRVSSPAAIRQKVPDYIEETEQWPISVNSEGGWNSDLAVDQNGNVYYSVTGTAGNEFIAKYDRRGKQLWQTPTNNNVPGIHQQITLDPVGNIYIVDQQDGNHSLIKYNNLGIEQWRAQLPGNIDIADKRIDKDGNLLIAGRGNMYSMNNSSLFFSKFDPEGKELWTNSYSRNDYNYLYGQQFAINDQENLYIGGYKDQSSVATGIYQSIPTLSLLNSQGNLVWNLNLDNSPSSFHLISDIEVSPAGDAYVAWEYIDNITSKVFVALVSSRGTIQWKRELDISSTYSQISEIKTNQNGDLFILGNAEFSSNGYISYLFLQKFDKNGNKIWRKWFENNIPNSNHSLALYQDLKIYLSLATYGQTQILKLDADIKESDPDPIPPAEPEPAPPTEPDLSACDFNGVSVPHNTSVTAYLNEFVLNEFVLDGQSCLTETRTCFDGFLSGSYGFNSCQVLYVGLPIDNVTADNVTGDSWIFTNGDSWIFTNAGATGYQGPTQAQIDSAYSGTNLQGSVTITTQGIQEWTVPTTGTYQIEVLGASAPPQTYTGTNNHEGHGAKLTGSLELVAGNKLFILVGQQPLQSQFNGGGGGTFVASGTNLSDTMPLIVAGGGASYRSGYDCLGVSGGGDTTCLNIINAVTSTSGVDSTKFGGDGGNGGINNGGSGGAGAGFYTDASETPATTTAFAFRNGGEGGTYTSNGGQNGGFGGGGHGGWGGAGGGGGYSGGGAPNNNPYPPGGGGGSFIASTATNVATSDGKYDGSTTFNGSVITNLNSFNSGHGSVKITLLSSAKVTLPSSEP